MTAPVDPNLAALLRSMKVPPNLALSRAFVDFLIEGIERGERGDTPQSPEEAENRRGQMTMMMIGSEIDVIAAIASFEEKFQVLIDTVNRQAAEIQTLNRLVGQQR